MFIHKRRVKIAQDTSERASSNVDPKYNRDVQDSPLGDHISCSRSQLEDLFYRGTKECDRLYKV